METDAQLIPVRDYMTRQVTSLPADLPMEDALLVLSGAGFSGAPVVEGDAVVGVLSDLDCVRVLSAAAFHAAPTGRVRDWMTEKVDALTEEQDMFAVSQRFLDSGHRRLPVVNAQGRLVGIVTLSDLGEALIEVHQQRTRLVRPEPHAESTAWDYSNKAR